VLERFAFLEVPEAEVERVLERANGAIVRGRELRLEPARG
jgi:hypothetical protein